MSFFGFDTTLPRDRGHQQAAPGFAAPQDAFADLSGLESSQNVVNFDDTYDGFGGELDPSADTLNDDTFGDGPTTQDSVGRDFDFSGRTDNVAQAFEEERVRWAAQHAPSRISPSKPTKPKRTGYEYIPQLEADADLWGIPKKEPEQKPPARKALTLEEVEAMLAQNKKSQPASTLPEPIPTQHPFPVDVPQFPPPHDAQYPQLAGQGQYQQQRTGGHPQVPQILQRPPQPGHPQPQHPPQPQQPPHEYRMPEQVGFNAHHPPQILQRQRPPQPEGRPAPTGPKIHHQQRQPPVQHQPPRQILQNPNRLSGHGQAMIPLDARGHARGSSYNGPLITNPQQILHLSEEDRAAFLQDDALRAKRNHKIHLQARYNGLMTPQDKHFITRIQLQQLVTATGNVDADGPEALLNEDFYYQVYSQIRGASRQNPHQPANQFAQTYLFQTGGRFMNRRNARGGDNHMQRMEQQVQRAVEAARAKPKNRQLVLEGSLGKISFSNSKTPRPLLNIKRTEGELKPNMAAKRQSPHGDAALERRTALRNIENVYSALMEMEDHVRQVPATEEEQSEWTAKANSLNAKLWTALRANEGFVPNSPTIHPFIALLSHSKGKKAIPRVFRHITAEQRTIIVTMIVVHLDSLDVVANALATPIPAQVKEEINLFASAIAPVLLIHVNEEPLPISLGLLGLILDRSDVRAVARTKVGLLLLTMLISRAELLKEAAAGPGASPMTPEDQLAWQQYATLYTTLFGALEPILPQLFPDQNPLATDDVHVWQFLAAMGVAASAEQQQRLVVGVKDRVMGSVTAARTLPAGEQERRLGEVNLFMRALGLDVELLALSGIVMHHRLPHMKNGLN